MKRSYRVLILGLGLAATARADYGWVPDYQKLFLKGGVDFFQTDQNYNTSGATEPLASNGSLHQSQFYLEGEYGIAPDWSVRGRFGFQSDSLSANTDGSELASASGPSNLTLGLKWNFKPHYPILTLEVYSVIPTTSNSVASPSQLVLNDGNFNLGIVLHSGARAGYFVFDLSPGILARFGGYSSVATVEAAIQLNFPKGFVRGFARGMYPFENAQPFDVDPTKHTAPGSGGSYEKLNGSPEGVSGGGMIGVVPVSYLKIEGYLEHAIYGKQYPYFSSFGFDLVYTFDFFMPKKKTKAREVPFEGEQPTGFPD